jgi:hypothetical protein
MELLSKSVKCSETWKPEVMVYLTIVCIVLLQIIMWSNSLNVVSIGAYIVNIVAVPTVCFIYMGCFDAQMLGALTGELSHAYPWLGMIVAIFAGVLPGFFMHLVQNRFRPTSIRLWSERLELAEIIDKPLAEADKAVPAFVPIQALPPDD